jgi:hypothetical protein
MPDIPVTMHARNGGVQGIRGRLQEKDVVDEAVVAAEAVLLKDLGVPWSDHDGLVEVLERKGRGVIPPVPGLGQELGDRGRREVTVVTSRDVVVA